MEKTPVKGRVRARPHSDRRHAELKRHHAQQDREAFVKAHVDNPRWRETIHLLKTGQHAVGLV